MIRRASIAFALLAGLALALAVPASADPPIGGTSTSPVFIRLVGSTAGVPDSLSGKFTVTYNDLANNPIPGARITVDFSGCSDIRMASNQLNPNYTVDCSDHTVSAYTNAQGVAAFTVLGGSLASGTLSGAWCARIFADGVLLSSPTVATFDLNGTGGVTAADLSVWLGDLGSGTYRGRSDFSGEGVISAADLSLWLGVLGRQGSSVSSATCP